MLRTFSSGSNTYVFFFFYGQGDEEAKSSPAKERESKEAKASSDDSGHHGNSLFQSSPQESDWKTVQKKSKETKAQTFGEGLTSVENPFFQPLLLHLISIEPSNDLVCTRCYTHALHSVTCIGDIFRPSFDMPSFDILKNV